MKLLGALCDGSRARHYMVPGNTHNVLEVDGSSQVLRFDIVRGKFFEVVVDEVLHGGIIVAVTYCFVFIGVLSRPTSLPMPKLPL